MIYLTPINGLCNRMRVIESGLNLAHELNTGLNIYWIQDRHLNCPFHLLFEPLERQNVTLIESRSYPFKMLQKSKRLRNLINNFPLPLLLFSSRDQEELMKYPFHKGNVRRHIVIQSFYRFRPFLGYYSVFNPIQKLKDQIQLQIAQFDEHVIGVHIRRTDHRKSTAASTDELFIAQMKQEIAIQPLTRFYLASDSLEVKEKLSTMFGDRIITSQMNTSRTSVNGMQDALVELYTLASTSRLLGSYLSSFSTTASELGKIPRITIQEQVKT